jgi:hypothetical protein
VDDGKTAGFTPWPGPELMKMIALAGDARTTYAKDVATGRDLVMMTGAMTTAAGRVSWFMEFDKETRLPVSMEVWNGPERSGPPSFSILRIAYHESLPERALSVHVPEGATFTLKPIVLPDANLALLENPNQGIPVEGLTRAQASRRILEQVYEAIIARDLAKIRVLCPLTASWSDQLLRTAILREGDEGRRPTAIVDIGGIAREGRNRIGPFAVVPVESEALPVLQQENERRLLLDMDLRVVAGVDQFAAALPHARVQFRHPLHRAAEQRGGEAAAGGVHRVEHGKRVRSQYLRQQL